MRILHKLKKRLQKLFNLYDFVGRDDIRSNSDNGEYVASVKNAISSYRSFKKFKLDPRYQRILEHTSREQGEAYLKVIKTQSPRLINQIDKFKINDLVGGSTTYEFEGVGSISPSTLRYLKVASDLQTIFGDRIGGQIAEIGCGYGGQLLILDNVFRFERYDLFDLPPVLSLTSMYLESHLLNASYNISTLNQHPGNMEYDLVISNYAFSELPSQLQMTYIRKIISKAKKGYLTMNTGKTEHSRDPNKLTIDELKNILPNFEILPETPSTSPNNYIIVWET
jgi:putative sugar O-methyltransferase